MPSSPLPKLPHRAIALALALLPAALMLCATTQAGTAPLTQRPVLSDKTPAEAARTPPAAPQVAPPPPPPVKRVALIRPKTELWPDLIDASGNIMPWQETHVGTEVGGLRLASVLISVGDTVSKGQVLARLDTATVQTDLDAANAQLMEAEGALAQAQATWERAKRLAPSGGVSQQDLTLYETQKNTAEARVNAARSQVKRQQLRLQFATLVAPDDGLISSCSATEGTIVQAGSELFRLIRQGRLEWRAEVKGETLLKLSAGQEVTVRSPLGSEVKGRIRRLSPTIDVATRNGLAYIDLPAGTNLKAGLNVSGTINIGKRKALLVPSSALLGDDKDCRVLRVGRDNRIEAVDVRVGRARDGWAEIVAGLDEQSLVVGSGVAQLKVGETVEASAPAAARDSEAKPADKENPAK